MQKMVAEANIKIKDIFGKLLTISGEKEAEQVIVETDLLMQGW